MLNHVYRTAIALCLAVFASSALAAPQIGESAPDFTGTDSQGQTVQLSSLRGKTVILEWTNHECPYVKKHYNGNMQSLQKAATADGAVWLTIISSAPGKQGHVSGEEADALSTSRQATPSHVILDENGAIGRLYDAKTTPHLFVINTEGVLVYAGGIDDKPTSKVEDIAKATNFVRAALADLKLGRDVVTPISRPYGCSIKYAE